MIIVQIKLRNMKCSVIGIPLLTSKIINSVSNIVSLKNLNKYLNLS